LLAVT